MAVVLSLCILILLTATFANCAIIRVKTDGADTSDGSTWALAKKTVQAALNAATSGDEVWVKAGTYTQSITLTAGVGLYGGFVGTETLRSERNFVTNLSILEGNGGSVVTSPSGATNTTIIDGFTIQKGSALSGGGIYCGHSGPTISNNRIVNNVAYAVYPDGGGCGGGIFCAEASAPVISNNFIAKNIAYGGETPDFWPFGGYGGGICCSVCSPTITGNTIMCNMVYSQPGRLTSEGGGIYLSGCTGSVIISNNLIEANQSDGDSGIGAGSTAAIVTNNIVVGNSGGGICSGGTITNNTIVGNGGYGIYPYSATVSNNIVAFNENGLYHTGTFRNNCVYGNSIANYAGAPGAGDISVDPGLVDLKYRNFHLQAGSPCIDAGWDSAPGIPAVDCDGQPRIVDGDGNGTAHVDIGSDETSGASWALGPYTIIRVKTDGNDSNDGSSWALAKKTLQAAGDAASLHGGEVWVKSGTYNGSVGLSAYSHLYGGFSGTETQRNQRDWRANKSIIDLQSAGSVSYCAINGVCWTVDGFTIRNGGISAGYPHHQNAATPSRCTIANNRMSGCTTGSAVSLSGSATVTNNEVYGNNAGISCSYGADIKILKA
jgi:hypothetical protein